MAKLLEFNFDETAGSGTAADSVGISGEHGTFYGDGTTDGSGGAVFDGSGDYLKVPSNNLFDLDQGTISMTFTLDALPPSNNPSGLPGAATLFSVDSSGLDGGGHLTVFVRSDGMLSVRHQTEFGESYMNVGFVTPGEKTTFEYEWSPTGSNLIMGGSTATTSTAFTMAGNIEPIVLGASQTQSGDGTADNLKGFFDGTIHHFALYDWPVADGVVPCFVAGTWIDTASGPRRVEDLEPGNLLRTRDHGLQPLILRDSYEVTADQLAQTPKRRPIRLHGDVFNGDDLLISRQHCVAMQAMGRPVFVRAVHLAATTRWATIENAAQALTYHHLLLPEHAVLCANGIACESLLPGPEMVKRLPPLRPSHGGLSPMLPILTGADVRRAIAAGTLAPAPWRPALPFAVMTDAAGFGLRSGFPA